MFSNDHGCDEFAGRATRLAPRSGQPSLSFSLKIGVLWLAVGLCFVEGGPWLVDNVHGSGAAVADVIGFVVALACIGAMYAMRRFQSWRRLVIAQILAGMAGLISASLGMVIGVIAGYWWMSLIGIASLGLEGEILSRRQKQVDARRRGDDLGGSQ